MRSDKESGEHLLTNGTGQIQCKREKVKMKNKKFKIYRKYILVHGIQK